jgi:hypothetical protein
LLDHKSHRLSFSSSSSLSLSFQTGKIGHDFCQAIKKLPEVQLVAVGSRKKETAEEFAKEFRSANERIL